MSPGYGLGATFRVELPAGGWPAEAEPAPLQIRQPAARRPLRLLLVEDHPDTAEAMASRAWCGWLMSPA